MLKHKWTDRLCCAALALIIIVTVLLISAKATGKVGHADQATYAQRLFDPSRVHTIDLVMADWDTFLETCTNEEYASCTAIIDGEKFAAVGIRAKGNTSLSSVAAYGNNRYSFKLEFDHYVSGKTYYGLDKLCLNNLIQDNTYMKDFLAYTLMGKMGVASPLCSYAYITVNGQPWGLYLAVEAVEEAFLARNYAGEAGELYKPDSMSMGGGRGNGREFDVNEFRERFQQSNQDSGESMQPERGQQPEMTGNQFDPSALFGQGGTSAGFPPNMTPPQETGDTNGSFNPSFPGGFGGMGSADVQLQYIDDAPESYPNIFSNAKTDVTDQDKARLIASLKSLSEGDISVVDQDAVIRYMAVHNFLCNDDSYTGMMVHNYYLYEKDGVLSMIPWDYNLSMGGMGRGPQQEGGATSTVNTPIDTLVTQGDMRSRPMAAWIFDSDETADYYHRIYREFIDKAGSEGWLTNEMEAVIAMIAPYVKKDPTAFCTYEAFQNASQALLRFCSLRAQSVKGQLDGEIPSTTDGQQADDSALIDAADLDLSEMGSMGSMGIGMPSPSGDDRKPPQTNQMPDLENENQTPMLNGQPPDFGGSRGGPSGSPSAVDSRRSIEREPEKNGSAGNQSASWPLAAATIALLLGGLLFAACKKSHN